MNSAQAEHFIIESCQKKEGTSLSFSDIHSYIIIEKLLSSFNIFPSIPTPMGTCGWCKHTVCVQYYEIILIYCITFIGNNLIVLLLRNNTFIICLTPFCSTDPFSHFLKFCLLKVQQFLQAYTFCHKVLLPDVRTRSASFLNNSRWHVISIITIITYIH
jgi:hypothetical protein